MFDLVVHEHPAFSNNYESSLLFRPKPRAVKVRLHAIGELQMKVDIILDVLLKDCLPPGLNPLRGSTHKIKEDGDVVHPQAEKGVFHRANGAQIEPFLVNGADGAQFSGVKEVLDLPDGRLIEEEVSDHEDFSPLLRQVHELFGLALAEGQGFLYKHVFSRLEGFLHQRGMGRRRRCNGHCGNVGPEKGAMIWIERNVGVPRT